MKSMKELVILSGRWNKLFVKMELSQWYGYRLTYVHVRRQKEFYAADLRSETMY